LRDWTLGAGLTAADFPFFFLFAFWFLFGAGETDFCFGFWFLFRAGETDFLSGAGESEKP
jgi:hypothetical protein